MGISWSHCVALRLCSSKIFKKLRCWILPNYFMQDISNTYLRHVNIHTEWQSTTLDRFVRQTSLVAWNLVFILYVVSCFWNTFKLRAIGDRLKLDPSTKFQWNCLPKTTKREIALVFNSQCWLAYIVVLPCLGLLFFLTVAAMQVFVLCKKLDRIIIRLIISVEIAHTFQESFLLIGGEDRM